LLSAKKSSKKKPTAKGCVKQTTAKYHVTSRKSPPYPANQCHGKSTVAFKSIKIRNDLKE